MNRTLSCSAYYYWLKGLLGSLFLLFYSGISFGQQENPFELKNRISPQKEIPDTLVSPSQHISSVILPDTLAPTFDQDTPVDQQVVFDLQQTMDSLDTSKTIVNGFLPDTISPDTAKALSVPDASVVETTQSGYTFSPTKKSDKSTNSQPGLVSKLDQLPLSNQLEADNVNVLLGISILSLLLLASLLAVNRSLVRKAYRAIANDNYLRFLYREFKSMPWLYWLFYLHFFMNAGFFTYLFLHYFHWYQGGSIVVLMFCILFVMGTYLLKHLSLGTIASTFPVEKEANLYGFVTMLVNILLGLALVPINLLIAFAPEPVVPFAVWIGISLVILMYTFRQLKGLFISGRLVRAYLFHFFLYLCSAEIAPLLIVGKLALGNIGEN